MPTCDDTPGRYEPRVNPLRCEGKAECVRVCPNGVFELRAPNAEERAVLTPFVRFKLWSHGGQQAFVANPDACHACGVCVTACPEKAIQLVRGLGGAEQEVG
jgi:NAD-dependent dihydropyrimidine dehydrogenase PreA subunit